MNKPELANLGYKGGQPCGIPKHHIKRHHQNGVKFARSVFLRDPLERFLSGFIDKCIRSIVREPSCEPMFVYRSNKTFIETLPDNPKRLFEAYVDTFPLKWNVHFYPQGMYCDGVFRHHKDYDFVGHMGKKFFDDVHAFGHKMGNIAGSTNKP